MSNEKCISIRHYNSAQLPNTRVTIPVSWYPTQRRTLPPAADTPINQSYVLLTQLSNLSLLIARGMYPRHGHIL